MSSEKCKKILIVGTSGCGKTTLARYLSRRTGLPAVDMDDLYWLPNWIPRSSEDFLKDVQEVVLRSEWILSGNYSRLSHLLWEKADMIIWLDLPVTILLWRALRRTLCRIYSKELCCNGNHESWRRLFSRKSIVVWILQTYRRRKRQYSKWFSLRAQENTRLLRISSDQELQCWLASLSLS